MSGRKTTMWERGLSLLLAVIMAVSSTGMTGFATDADPDKTDTAATEAADETADSAEGTEAVQITVPEDDQDGEPEATQTAATEDASDGSSTDDPTDKPTDDPVDEPTDDPVDEPTDDPVDEPTDDPVDEPADDPVDEPTDDPADEPIQPAPEKQPLSVELRTETRVAYTFTTDDAVIDAGTTTDLRFWNETENDKYKSFTDSLPQDEQIVAAFVLSDGTAEENVLTFDSETKVFFSDSRWDWDKLNREEVRENYTLYLADAKGELKQTDFEVLFAADRDNDRGDAIAFETKTLSCILLTEQVKPEVENYDRLVEVEASDDEPLLAESALSRETQMLLNGVNGPRKAPASGASGSDAEDTSSGDGIKIEKITIRWLSKSASTGTAAGFDMLDLAPDTDAVPTQQFQVDFALSGKDKYEPGQIELVFPAYIWLNKSGKEPGRLTLSVPEDPEKGAEFSWRRVGNNIVLTNTKRLSAACTVMIQGSFRDVEAHTMDDGIVSNEMYATVNVVTPEDNVLTMTSNSIRASLDTGVKLVEALKTAYDSISRKYDVFFDTNSVPSALLPQNPDDYFYVRWYVSGRAAGSQSFTMTMTDTAEDNYNCVMLGVEGSLNGTVRSRDGKTVTATLYDGYTTAVKTAYVWTAYPLYAFPQNTEETFELSNTATVSVTGKDDGITITDQATAKASTRMPITYTFIKQWDDNNSPDRPTYIYLLIYQDSTTDVWRSVRLSDANNWTYSWSDGGVAHNYRVREQLVNWKGVGETFYDADGYRHQYEWNYLLKSQKYDNATHTWTYVNTRSEGWIKYDVSSMSKYVEYKYDDPNTTSLRDNALNRLRRGESVEVAYNVNASIAMAMQTVHYGLKPVTAGVRDYKYLLNGKEISTDSVEISRISLYKPTVYSYQNYDDSTGYYQRVLVEEPQTVLFYGYLNDEWTLMATMNGSTITAVANSGASVSGSMIYLPEGVSQVKAELETSEAIVNMGYTVYLKVKPSDEVLSAIEKTFETTQYAMFSLRNQAESYFYYGNERTPSMQSVDVAYLHGRDYKVAVDLDKKFVLGENQVIERRIPIHTTLTLTEQSNVLTREDYDEAVASGDIPSSKSGTFYDLLPQGVEPDLDSITLSDGGRVLEAYVIPNFRDSERTMLVVKARLGDDISYVSYRYNRSRTDRYASYSTYPLEGYRNVRTLEFDAYYSWDEAQDDRNRNIDSLRNTAAYEADEDILGTLKNWLGEPDDPNYGSNVFSKEVRSDASYFTDLDPNRDDPAFAYAGATVTDISPDLSAVTGLSKQVMAAGFPRWGDGQGENPINVQEGGQYIYRLQVQGKQDVKTTNIIIFDSLENYVPEANDEENDVKPRWHGTLLGVDVSQMVEMGAAPVIYYSTVANLDLTDSDNTDLTNTAVWSKTAPSSLSSVKAIAIDVRKRADGSNFELESGAIIAAQVKMRAPAGDSVEQYFTDEGKDPTQNGHAYNAVYMTAAFGLDPTSFVRFTYTKVGIFAGSFHVEKVWDDVLDNDAIRPDSATLTLLANGEPALDSSGNLQVITLDDSNEWKGEFKHLPVYDDSGNYIVYTFAEDDVQDYTPEFVRDGDTVIVHNHHDLYKTEVPVTKIWTEDNDNTENTRPASITMRLYADGVFTGKTIVLRADENGEWKGKFTDLNVYDSGRLIEYTVQESGVENYIPSYDDNAHTVTNRYYPYGDLIVSKEVRNATPTSEDKEFTFTLTLQDSEGNDVIQRYPYIVTDSTGAELRTGTMGNGGEFTLKGGESLTLKDIPTGIKYSVTEESTEGFTLASASSASGTIHSYAPAEAQFVNEYHSVGTVDLAAAKTLTGRPKIQRYQFVFEIAENGEVVNTANVDDKGAAPFSVMRYSEADDGVTHTYTVYEVDRGKGGYTYDDTQYRLEVTPHDNGDGTMTCDVHSFLGSTELLDDNGQPLLVFDFANRYEATGSITFRAWKSLNGRDLTADEFQFELVRLDENGMPDDSTRLLAKNNENGEIQWDTITFDQDSAYTDTGEAPVYIYIAREIAGDDTTVVYSKEVKAYQIKVIDNGDGTISFDQTNVTVVPVTTTEDCPDCTDGTVNGEPCQTCGGAGTVEAYTGAYEKVDDNGGLPVFTNTLENGALSITKYTTWTDIEPNSGERFHFHVQLISDDLEDGAVIGYSKEQVPNIGQVSNPTTPRSAPTTSREVTASGTLSSSVKWTLYANGELVIEPTNGSSGTAAGKTSSSAWPWYNNRSKIHKVTVKDTVKITGSTAYMFYDLDFANQQWYGGAGGSGYKGVTFDLSGLDTSEVTNMEYMFAESDGAVTVDLSGLDTHNVTNMRYMFYNCQYLQDVNMHGMNTAKVTNMSSMFYQAGNALDTIASANAKLNVNMSGLDLRALTSYSTMFSGNQSSYYDYSRHQWVYTTKGSVSVNMSDVKFRDDVSFNPMFSNINVAMLDLTRADFGARTSAEYMFSSSVFKNIVLTNAKMPNVTSLSCMFSDATNLEYVNLKGLQTGTLTSIGYMFDMCYSLKAADLSGLDTSQVTSMDGVFFECHNLSSVNLNGLDTRNVTSIEAMFAQCRSLKSLDLSQLDLGNAVWTHTVRLGNQTFGLFEDCSNLTSLKLPERFVTDKMTDMTDMFAGCSKLASIDTSGWDTSNVYHMYNVFRGCSSLSTLDLRSWDTSSAARSNRISGMFYGCTALSTVYLGENFKFKWNSYSYSDLPNPPHNQTYTGLWVREGDPETAMSAADLRQQYTSSLAGKWVWDKETYQIVFQAPSDEYGGSMTPQTAVVNRDTILNPNRFYRFGYEFVGWDINGDGVRDYEDTDGIRLGEADVTVTLTAIFQPETREVTLEDGSFDFYLLAGERVTIPNLPAGTSYLVWEETPAGWVLVDQQNSSGSIEPLQTAAATFTNKYEPGTATIAFVASKTMDGKAADNGAFTFELLDGDEVLQTVTNGVAGSIRFEGIRFTPNDIGRHTYTIREVVGTDSTVNYDRHEETVTVIIDGDANNLNAKATYDSDGAKFANSTRPGALTITKNVSGGNDVNANAVFTFHIRLTNSGGMPLNGVAGAVDGLITVTAKANETVTIPDLPAGTRYEVVEIELPDGWNQTSISGESGAIASTVTSQVSITNTYSASGYAVISAHKLFEGATAESGQFRFELYDKNPEIQRVEAIDSVTNGPLDTVTQITNEDGSTSDNPWYGFAPVIFDALEFTEPGDYTYWVVESAGNDNRIIYDEHVEEVVIHVRDNNGNGVLDTEVEYDSDGALFTNRMKPGSLTVSKTVLNGTAAALSKGEFTFTLHLMDASGNDLTGTYPVSKNGEDAGTVQNGGTVTLHAGESFTVNELPHGCRYTVTEEEAAGFELANAVSDQGVIDVGVEGGQSARFENAYSTSGTVELKAKKTLLGGELTADRFSFRVTDSDGRTLCTAYADANGNIVLPIDFSVSDDGKSYTYYINEVDNGESGITYDDHIESVKVYVSDNGDGTMTVNTVYDEDGAVFVNTRDCILTVSKTVEGNLGDRTTAFDFRLTLTKNGEPYTAEIAPPEGVDSWKVAGEGVYTFSLSHGESVDVTIPGGVDYDVTEDTPADYEASVTITDANGATVANAADAPTAAGSMDGDRNVAFVNTREGTIPTGTAVAPTAEPAILGIGILASTGLIILLLKKRRAFRS